MIFMFDNNLPPALAYAINQLSKREFDGQHEIFHLRDRFSQNTPDAQWIEALSSQKKTCAVITRDKLDKGMEAYLLRNSGLIVFHLDQGWDKKFWNQSVNLIRWWPSIVQQAKKVSGGAAFRIKWHFSGKFEQLRRF